MELVDLALSRSFESLMCDRSPGVQPRTIGSYAQGPKRNQFLSLSMQASQRDALRRIARFRVLLGTWKIEVVVMCNHNEYVCNLSWL